MAIFPASQNKRRALITTLILAGVPIIIALSWLQRGGVNPVLQGVVVVVATAMAILGVLQFFTLDEAQKRANYISWYWGVTLASTVIVGLYLALFFDFVSFEPIAASIAHTRLGDGSKAAYLAGLITGPILLVLGYFVCYGAYALRRR